MNLSELLKEFDALNLHSDGYIITSSGALAARGIREANDLDVLVSDEVWQGLIQKYPVNTEGFQKIAIGNIEILGQGSIYKELNPEPVEEQIKDAEVIDGHKFAPLETIRRIKLQLGREKDLKDIELIDQYLSTQYFYPTPDVGCY